MSGGNCHVLAKRVAPGSSKAIAHGIGKQRQVQNQLLVSLHADKSLLRLLISLSHVFIPLDPLYAGINCLVYKDCLTALFLIPNF